MKALAIVFSFLVVAILGFVVVLRLAAAGEPPTTRP